MRRLTTPILIIGAILVALGGSVVRSQISIPNSFSNNTIADPDQVNANFTQLGNLALNLTGGTMTGTLTSRNIVPSADATYALGDGTHRFTNAFFSGTVTAASFSGFVTGAMTLLHEASGTTNNVAAETVDTYALASQLTATDKLLIVTKWRSGSGDTTTPQVKNATDGNVLFGLAGGANVAALVTDEEFGLLQPSLETLIDIYVGARGSDTSPSTTQTGGAVAIKRTARTTAWTGAWSISYTHGGVANPGTSAWEWAIYKVAGS